MQQEPPAEIGEYTFDELYSSLYGDIILSVRNKFLFLTQEEAEDITQDAFMKAYEKREQFKGQSHPKYWIWVIAKRRAIDYYRKRKIRGYPINYEGNSDSIDALVNAGRSEQSLTSREDALPKLTALAESIKPPKRRKIFELRYLQYKTCKELSKQLGMEENAVRQNLYRAKNDLIKKYCPKKA